MAKKEKCIWCGKKPVYSFGLCQPCIKETRAKTVDNPRLNSYCKRNKKRKKLSATNNKQSI